MANNFRDSGRKVPIASASADLTAGALAYQENICGIVDVSVLSGAEATLDTQGVFTIAVPSNVVKGDLLYADLSAESADLLLTEVSDGLNTFIGVALTARDATTLDADVRLCPGQLAGTLPMAAAGKDAKLATFIETTDAGTYTSPDITVPGGAIITNISVWSDAVWDTANSATMIVGDDTDPNGWFTAIDLLTTDLENFEYANFNQSGGLEGVQLVPATGVRIRAYSTAPRVITGEIITVGVTGTAGRTFMLVEWVVPSEVLNATKIDT